MSSPPAVRLARLAMATRFELVIADEGDVSDLHAIGEEALDEISLCEQLLSVHREDGGLYQVNKRAADGPVRTDARICSFIETAQQMASATQGTCDIAVGPLLRLWHIHRQDHGETSGPSDVDIQQALQLIDVRQQVSINKNAFTVQFKQPGVRLDPGALGKGWAIDRAVAILREHGVRNALLHGGTSSVYALGSPRDQATWNIHINDHDNKQIIATAHLSNSGLSVSAIHGRQLKTGDQEHGHVLDPRTGKPVSHIALAAVVHDDSVVAEAFSTSLLVDPHIIKNTAEQKQERELRVPYNYLVYPAHADSNNVTVRVGSAFS